MASQDSIRSHSAALGKSKTQNLKYSVISGGVLLSHHHEAEKFKVL